MPARLSDTERLFVVPAELVGIMNRDLQIAGPSKRDDKWQTVDVHALRHTFGSLLFAGGVSPRTAQQAMRHSSIELTMTRYTDSKLLDVAGAMTPCHGYFLRMTARKPHVADDHQTEVVIQVLESLCETLACCFGPDVASQQLIIIGAAGHHDFHNTVLIVSVMPFGAECFDCLVKAGGNVATHRHEHCLAFHRSSSLLPMLHDEHRKSIDALRCADQCF